MTIKEKQSARKCLAIRNMVLSGEYSPSYALQLVEDYFDAGKLTDTDYDTIATWLEEIINGPTPEEPEEEETEVEADEV